MGKDIPQDRVFERLGYRVVHVKDSEFKTSRGRDDLVGKIREIIEGDAKSAS